MDVLIRPITLDDVPALRVALDAVCRERLFLAMLEAPPVERLHAFIAAILERDDPQFIAEMDGRIVGWCDIRSGTVTTGTAHVGHMGMGVLPEVRRRGIGLRLVESALRKARSKGLEKIETRLYASNAAALALYRKVGFFEEGRKRRGRCVDGVYADVIEMGYFFEAPAG
jgi:ribosomal protein S18 acetylase RimI-like enzyme